VFAKNAHCVGLFLLAFLSAFVLSPGSFAAAGQPGFLDEFEGPDLDPRWEWYTPFTDPVGAPTYELVDGTFVLSFPAGDYDSWAGFDRAPRLRTAEFSTDQDFRIETFVSVEEPTIPTFYHTGLWVEFLDRQGGPIDGWFFGFYSREGWQGNYTIRAERVGHRSPPSADDFPVPWGTAEAFLKIERVGDIYSFYYKEEKADPWILLHTATSQGETVTHVGLFAKNWTAVHPAVRASFDYFLLGDPETVAPELGDMAPSAAIVGLSYCAEVPLLGGFPEPTWQVSATPQPASPPTISEDGTVSWEPQEADQGKTFTFTVTAQNGAGSDNTSWEVTVYPELTDEFEGPNLTPPFVLLTPQTGPELTFTDGWAYLSHLGIGDDGMNYDTWVGFDRMPRIVAALPTCGDFVVETVMNLTEVNVGGLPTEPTQVHAGIWIAFQSAQVDGLMFGPYTSRTTLRLERVGTHEELIPIAVTDQLGLKVERRGEKYFFQYRTDPDAPWENYGTYSLPGMEVAAVGLFSKNWIPDNPEVTAAFDYLRIQAAGVQAPVLEDPCPEEQNVAGVGAPFRKIFKYVPGTPRPTTVTVDGPGTFDEATGTYSLTPTDPGLVTVTITASMEGQPEQSVSLDICVVGDHAPYEQFDVDSIEDLDPIWEQYNPAAVVPSPFSITDGMLQMAVPGGTAFDHWAAADMAPQLRLRAVDEPLLEHPFTIETEVHLDQYQAGTNFHVGIAVGFGPYEVFYWGPYMGTDVRLERSGVNNMIHIPNTAATVTLRIQKDCTNTLFFSFKPEDGDWQEAGSAQVPQAWLETDDADLSLWVGTILKTWAGGAQVSATFSYFDILESTCGVQPGPVFRRGDVNVDGSVNIADAITILGHLFGGEPAPSCPDAADTNDDGAVNIADAIKVLGFLFGGEGPLPEPSERCGLDPTPDTLAVCVFSQAACPP